MESIGARRRMACGSLLAGYDHAMDPMPRSVTLVLVAIAVIGVAAAVITYVLTPERPTPDELADQARALSADRGLDQAETEQLIAGCAEIKQGYSRLWSGMVSARYDACLREAKLLQ